MGVDLSKLIFYSGVNYMKRSGFCDNTTITLGGTTTTPVNHNLGYIPFYDVFMTDGDGVLWNGSRVEAYTGSATQAVWSGEPKLNDWTTTSTLTMSVSNAGSLTGTRKLYWLVYFDYGDVS